jgi:hypothetical protein
MVNPSSLSAVFLAIFLAGCGHAINDRNATWCVEDERLLAPSVAAADEWRSRSDGEVDFSFVRRDDCSDYLPRVVFGETDTDAAAHCTRDGEIVIRKPEWAHRVNLLHEFGHYLTGPDHSADTRDVMQSNGPMTDETFLTGADVARLDRPSSKIKSGW